MAQPRNDDTNAADAEAAYRLVAYPVNQPLSMPLLPAPANRAWMDETYGGFDTNRFAYRCLPLLMANQHGWVLQNKHRFFAIWNGGKSPSDLSIVVQKGSPPYPFTSHFGDGILSFVVPYLFRTPPGFNLLVRGPANFPKDGASPLEGLVETDWTYATFSMNWKITRPNVPVIFGVDEPICMIVPQRRADLENFRPEVRDIGSSPDVERGFQEFHESRNAFQGKLRVGDAEAREQGWQRNYFRGASIDGERASQHQTRLHLHPFVDK
jgi:uncharacterized protein DUF6065